MPLIGNKDTKKMTAPLLVQANNDIRGIYLAGLKNIVEGTPVDSGRARNNWFLSVDYPSENTTDSISTDSNSVRQAKSLPKSIFNKRIFFSNNLPYINRLEYVSWSVQAPVGWVRITLIKMLNKIRSL